jgi:hypothetical protein
MCSPTSLIFWFVLEFSSRVIHAVQWLPTTFNRLGRPKNRRMRHRYSRRPLVHEALIDPNVQRSEIGSGRDRLRVMIWKSENFTLRVTVRPRTPVVAQ